MMITFLTSFALTPVWVGLALLLWTVAGWQRIQHFAPYFQQERENIQRYSQRLAGIKRERRELQRAAAYLFSIVAFGLIVARARYDVPGVVSALALYAIMLALIEWYVIWLDRRQDKRKLKRTPEYIRLIRFAYVVDAAPLILYLITMFLSLFLPLDRLSIAFIGVLAAPLPMLLAFAALPLASRLVSGWGKIGQ
jgi:hypothetical protein